MNMDDDRIWRWAAFGPALVLMVAMAVLPLANLFLTSFYDVSWTGGQARWTPVGLAHYPRAFDRSPAQGRGGQHDPVRHRRRRRADGRSAFCWPSWSAASTAGASSSAPSSFSHPHSRHRHRRDLEADAQLRFRAGEPGAGACRHPPARLARRQVHGAGHRHRRRYLALDAVLLPAFPRRPRIAAARHLRGGADRRRVALAGVSPGHHPADDPDDPGHLRLPPGHRLQGLRRGLPDDQRRARHLDRSGQLHPLPALLHRGSRRLRLGDVGRGHLPRLAPAGHRPFGGTRRRGPGHERAVASCAAMSSSTPSC